MKKLLDVSLKEKVAYFYSVYSQEQDVDRDLDRQAIKIWDKISCSVLKSHDRIAYLLCQIQNVSASEVCHLDTSYRAKRELLLLCEGNAGRFEFDSDSLNHAPKCLSQLNAARKYNECFQGCGAADVFSAHLLKSLEVFREMSVQNFDQDHYESHVQSLQLNVVLMYFLIVFNRDKNLVNFERQMFVIGCRAPTFTLASILEILNKFHGVPAFPIKRLLMLFKEWFSLILGNFEVLDKLKRRRRRYNQTLGKVASATVPQLKAFKEFKESILLDPQDPFYMQKAKCSKKREEIVQKYLYLPHFNLERCKTSSEDSAKYSIDRIDEEWEDRAETIYALFLSSLHEVTITLSSLITASSSAALSTRDKKTFFPIQNASEDHGEYHIDASNEAKYWKWLKREKTIILDYCCSIFVLLYKQFRASHACKGDYLIHLLLEANTLSALTKFMYKDLVTYLQAVRPENDDAIGFCGLDNELAKKTIKFDDDMVEYAILPTRCMTTVLRLIQKLTKRKPNVIKSALCRTSSIVWLKRVVGLRISTPRLYALKLVKSQAKYLGHQWLRKYTCLNLLTDIYLYVRPELQDDWLQYEDDDLNKPPAQENVERIMFGEVQAYHHKYYWDSALTKYSSNQQSLALEARLSLTSTMFQVDGGPIIKFYDNIKLDAVNFCQQYENWLDKEGLTSSHDGDLVPLPIAFE